MHTVMYSCMHTGLDPGLFEGIKGLISLSGEGSGGGGGGRGLNSPNC